MRMLITGGAGFVGTNLGLFFAKKGWKIICVDNMSRAGVEANAKRLIRSGIGVWATKIQDDIRYSVNFKPDIILNCAAQSGSVKGMENPSGDFYDNLETVLACLEIARLSNSRLIHWSTSKVYPDVIINAHNTVEEATRYRVDFCFDRLEIAYGYGARSIYGATKLAAEVLIEEWSRAYGIPAIINRFSSLAGKYQMGFTDQGWAAVWVIYHLFGKSLSYLGWGGKQVRDVLAAEDVCDLIEKQVDYLSSARTFETYSVGGGIDNAISLLEATKICQDLTGNTVPIEHGPARWSDHRVFVSGIDDVCRLFSWQPQIRPKDILKEIYEWAKNEKSTLAQYFTKK